MSDALTEPTGLESQYAAQLSADLERNATEQDRIGAEVIALQEKLKGLQRDRELLLRLQRLLGEQSTQAEPTTRAEQPQEGERSAQAESPAEAAAEPQTAEAEAQTEAAPAKRVPAPRGSRPATRPTKARGSSAGTRTKRTGRKKAAPPKSKEKSKDKAKDKAPAGPTLIELVRAHLGEQKEPRSAAEVTAALTQDHPERPVKTTVVRTTLENLVAKGQAQRSKQKNSVFYSAPEAGEQQPAPAQEAAAEPEPKPEG
ncbi:hypothetical protein GCM10018785_50730 [Streptomyces longispororuber]|uniref:Regulatory protein n=1 Tax=Streptomyces longispororuber TaxID=68230 RepID=A0A919DRU9_9ACTN|nr:hypothetical protein [Streptomyces longispororuber]GHE76346.1 hypothetical protein GCM10018785_50730 [Streptomyces longispororuber]